MSNVTTVSWNDHMHIPNHGYKMCFTFLSINCLSKTLKQCLPQARNKKANPLQTAWCAFAKETITIFSDWIWFFNILGIKNYLLLLCVWSHYADVYLRFLRITGCVWRLTRICVEWVFSSYLHVSSREKGQYFLWHNFYFSTLSSGSLHIYGYVVYILSIYIVTE